MMKKNLLRASVIVSIVLIAFAITRWDWVKAYYSNLLHNPFKHGDKIYATSKIFGNNKSTAIILYRFVRPLNAKEIEAFKPSALTLKQMEYNIEHLPESYVITCGKMFTRATLNEQKSALLGIYVKNKLCRVWYNHMDRIHAFNGFNIKPTAHILDLSYDKNNVKIPQGFTWVNNELYVYQGDVTNTELPSFQQP